MSGEQVTLVLTLESAPPGEHAVHIHENGACGTDGMAAGDHWNPTGHMHGHWGEGEFHLGDIGNVTVDANGRASMTHTTDLWTLGDGAETDVEGHAVVVHADPDDFTTQPSGDAGTRSGCGVIEGATH